MKGRAHLILLLDTLSHIYKSVGLVHTTTLTLLFIVPPLRRWLCGLGRVSEGLEVMSLTEGSASLLSYVVTNTHHHC